MAWHLRLSSAVSDIDLKRGGAKRHRKILRDNIQGITKPVSTQPFLYALSLL